MRIIGHIAMHASEGSGGISSTAGGSCSFIGYPLLAAATCDEEGWPCTCNILGSETSWFFFVDVPHDYQVPQHKIEYEVRVS